MRHLKSSVERAVIAVLVMGTVAIAACSPAAAGLVYDVTQDGAILGSIMPFSGTETAAGFYDYGGPHTFSGGPAGVPLGGSTSVLYVYRDPNTGEHSLGWIHGKESETPHYTVMQGEIEVTDYPSAPAVLVWDDPGARRAGFDPGGRAPGEEELYPSGTAAGTFLGHWAWGPGRTDGGVVGPIGDTICTDAVTVTITDGPWEYDRNRQFVGPDNDMEWIVASGDGSWIPLNAAVDDPVTLHPTPELPPFALASLALPLSWLRCRFRRNKKK
jgi:hypothetical protein